MSRSKTRLHLIIYMQSHEFYNVNNLSSVNASSKIPNHAASCIKTPESASAITISIYFVLVNCISFRHLDEPSLPTIQQGRDRTSLQSTMFCQTWQYSFKFRRCATSACYTRCRIIASLVLASLLKGWRQEVYEIWKVGERWVRGGWRGLRGGWEGRWVGSVWNPVSSIRVE